MNYDNQSDSKKENTINFTQPSTDGGNYHLFTNTKTDVINHQNILSAKHQPKIIGMLGNNSLNVTSQSFNMKTASVGLGEKS